MALRIESWLGVDRGGRADLWLAEQAAYELWKARHASPSDRDQRSVQRAPEPQAV
jgi:plasmid maintenance system antidote protein VapI